MHSGGLGLRTGFIGKGRTGSAVMPCVLLVCPVAYSRIASAEGNVDVSSEAKEKAEREKRQLAKLRKEFRYQAALWVLGAKKGVP